MAASVVVATGLRFEARIAAGAGVRVVCRQNPELAQYLAAALEPGCRGIVSFGIAGGLTEALRPGDWVVARELVDGSRRHACDARWSEALLRALPAAHYADMAGVKEPMADTDAKQALHTACGATTVDMESQIVARIASARGIPFVCCRVVADPLERMLPPAALAGIRGDGSTDVLAVLRSLCARPGQLRALLALARDARIARRALAQGRQGIGEMFGLMP